MSNLAYKLQQQKQYVEQPKPSSKKLFVRKVTKGEKALWTLAIAALLAVSVYVVSTYASVYSLNRDIHDLEAKIETQEKINSELKQEVAELSKLERIYEKAQKLGLTFNNDNVKFLEE
ncbi:MAG TPA: cell division protein FtsL [Bacillales bacterium]|nr:cell division protein FtsL [Bacillales bacterium]